MEIRINKTAKGDGGREYGLLKETQAKECRVSRTVGRGGIRES